MRALFFHAVESSSPNDLTEQTECKYDSFALQSKIFRAEHESAGKTRDAARRRIAKQRNTPGDSMLLRKTSLHPLGLPISTAAADKPRYYKLRIVFLGLCSVHCHHWNTRCVEPIFDILVAAPFHHIKKLLFLFV